MSFSVGREQVTDFTSQDIFLVEQNGQTMYALASDLQTWLSVDSTAMQYRGVIGDAVDLNTHTATGMWSQQSATFAVNGVNYPADVPGQLSVLAAEDDIYQRYTTLGGADYVRRFDGTSWSAWGQVFSTLSPPAWGDVTSKPATFPPDAHSHDWADITGEPVYTTRWAAWSEVTSKPATFPPSAHSHAAGDLPVGIAYTDATEDILNQQWKFRQTTLDSLATIPNGNHNLVVYNTGDGTTAGAALMTFHRGGSFAAYFGLDTDNKLKIGGWSEGTPKRIFHEGEKPHITADTTGITISATQPAMANGDIWLQV